MKEDATKEIFVSKSRRKSFSLLVPFFFLFSYFSDLELETFSMEAFFCRALLEFSDKNKKFNCRIYGKCIKLNRHNLLIYFFDFSWNFKSTIPIKKSTLFFTLDLLGENTRKMNKVVVEKFKFHVSFWSIIQV